MVNFDPPSKKAVDLAMETVLSCHLEDVGLDICEQDGEFFVLEANMRYGREGLKKAGIDYVHLMESLIEDGII